jgi:hypothetical protein
VINIEFARPMRIKLRTADALQDLPGIAQRLKEKGHQA